MKKILPYLLYIPICCIFLTIPHIPVSFAETISADVSISRSFLGAYKKVMRYCAELSKYTDKYNVDILLVLAIAMYESGGNDNLLSSAKAKGMMQVMDGTKKEMEKNWKGIITLRDEVFVKSPASVREKPTISSHRKGVKKIGSRGLVVLRSVKADGYTWWKVDYEKGADGWTAGFLLKKRISVNEAGVKYLSYLEAIFRQYLIKKYNTVSPSRLNSLVIAGYNGGASRAKKGLVKVETFQYLQGVSVYYHLLSERRKEIDEFASELGTMVLGEPKSFEDLSGLTGVSILKLRLYNPFLSNVYSGRKIKKESVIIYPKNIVRELHLEVALNGNKPKKFYYIVKCGDIFHHVVNAFFRAKDSPNTLYDDVRDREGLLMWGSLQPGTRIEVTNNPYLK